MHDLWDRGIPARHNQATVRSSASGGRWAFGICEGTIHQEYVYTEAGPRGERQESEQQCTRCQAWVREWDGLAGRRVDGPMVEMFHLHVHDIVDHGPFVRFNVVVYSSVPAGQPNGSPGHYRCLAERHNFGKPLIGNLRSPAPDKKTSYMYCGCRGAGMPV
jgi:hypothetical protein